MSFFMVKIEQLEHFNISFKGNFASTYTVLTDVARLGKNHDFISGDDRKCKIPFGHFGFLPYWAIIKRKVCQAFPLQAWTGLPGSRRLRLQNFSTIST
jgi:hypothetical protein